MTAASKIIVCVLLPRFELVVAAGDRAELLGVPAVIAPEPGGQQVGAVSAAAEGFGIGPGMRLGEALARCPRLLLIPPDPAGVEQRWERMLIALESIGAAVEPLRPGLACFDARGLLRLHAADARRGRGPGGLAVLRQDIDVLRQDIDVLRQDIDAVLTAARRALGMPARFGVAPARFVALAAATRARVRQPLIIGGGRREAREFLAPLPVELLRGGAGEAELALLPEALQRLGIGTLGQLAGLPRAAVADRFGAPGLQAQRLALGGDTPLRPRVAGEDVSELLELSESASGQQLERALGLLIDRLLARHERRGRTLRAVVLSAVLVQRGGTWRQRLVFREALNDPLRMRLALVPRLQLLPAPAEALRLTVVHFGPPAGDQPALLEEPARARAARLREAVRQVRAAAGPDAALRILQIDPHSRFPERRSMLAPFER